MEETHDSQTNWEAKVSTTLTKVTADQIWSLVQDFFNYPKHFPAVSTSYGIHGANGEPGCMRYCGFALHSNNDGASVDWVKEKLIAIDHMNRSLSYEIVESSIAFKGYVSTLKISTGDGAGGDRCLIEWSFVTDPMEGWRLEDLVRLYEGWLPSIASNMEDAIINTINKDGL